MFETSPTSPNMARSRPNFGQSLGRSNAERSDRALACKARVLGLSAGVGKLGPEKLHLVQQGRLRLPRLDKVGGQGALRLELRLVVATLDGLGDHNGESQALRALTRAAFCRSESVEIDPISRTLGQNCSKPRRTGPLQPEVGGC